MVLWILGRFTSTCVTLNGSMIQLAVGSQLLVTPKTNFWTCLRTMVKRLATSSHDLLGITDSSYKNHLIMISVQFDPFSSNMPTESTTIGKSRFARDSIIMHTSWRSNSDVACVTRIGYPCTRASGESSTTKHRLLQASEPHPIPPHDDPNGVGPAVGERVRLISKGNETAPAVRHAPPRTHGPNSPTLTHIIGALCSATL
ncbi:hypothetical protein F511_42430 [Dorcoceras hygrometricum]|uniref:Uncharacterized protein n=1 Tax=Dorcoceras hygrometricum TaxID=472368 RepID=A0A2Z7A3P1_9LAMI|nr:hypothetical protein F511_42430 [Dorcoceras hygrometricum]